MPGWAWAALVAGFVAVVLVLLVAAGSSRGSHAEDQREDEGGWRP